MSIDQLRGCAIAGLLLLAGGCSASTGIGGSAEESSATSDLTRVTASGFVLAALHDGLPEAGAGARWSLAVDSSGSSTAVTIAVDGTRGQTELFFDLAYDPQRLTPLGVTPALQFGAADQRVELALLGERGVVHYGVVMAQPQQHAGISGSSKLATVRFARQPQPAARTSSDALPRSKWETIALFDTFRGELTWKHVLMGDYNQDGVVDIHDLTPLGAHFNEFIDVQSASADYLLFLDTSRDQYVDIYDLTAIGLNWGRTITGYRVLASFSELDHPQAGEPDGPGTLIAGELSLADSVTTSPGTERLKFVFLDSALDPEKIYWVRPLSADGTAGAAGYDRDHVGFRAPWDPVSAPLLAYNPPDAVLSWKYSLLGDGNQDGVISLEDLTPLWQYIGQAIGPAALFPLRLVDADVSGEITMMDMSRMGQNLDRRIDGYNVYASMNVGDYPNAPLTPVGHMGFKDAVNYGQADYYLYEFTLHAPQPGLYVWIKPHDFLGNEGVESLPLQLPTS